MSPNIAPNCVYSICFIYAHTCRQTVRECKHILLLSGPVNISTPWWPCFVCVVYSSGKEWKNSWYGSQLCFFVVVVVGFFCIIYLSAVEFSNLVGQKVKMKSSGCDTNDKFILMCSFLFVIVPIVTHSQGLIWWTLHVINEHRIIGVIVCMRCLFYIYGRSLQCQCFGELLTWVDEGTSFIDNTKH